MEGKVKIVCEQENKDSNGEPFLTILWFKLTSEKWFSTRRLLLGGLVR